MDKTIKYSSVIHLHPLNYEFNPLNLYKLTNEELILLPFHSKFIEFEEENESEVIELFNLKINKIWSNRREKFRLPRIKPGLKPLELGLEGSERPAVEPVVEVEEEEEENLLSIPYSFNLKELNKLSSNQLSLVQFHSESNTLLQLKSEKIWRSRRENDLLLGYIYKKSISTSNDTIQIKKDEEATVIPVLSTPIEVEVQVNEVIPIASNSRLPTSTPSRLLPLPSSTPPRNLSPAPLPITPLRPSVSEATIVTTTTTLGEEREFLIIPSSSPISLPPIQDATETFILPPPPRRPSTSTSTSSVPITRPLPSRSPPSSPVSLSSESSFIVPSVPSTSTLIPSASIIDKSNFVPIVAEPEPEPEPEIELPPIPPTPRTTARLSFRLTSKIFSLHVTNLSKQIINTPLQLTSLFPLHLKPDSVILLKMRSQDLSREGYLGFNTFDKRTEAMQEANSIILDKRWRIKADYVESEILKWEWLDLNDTFADTLWRIEWNQREEKKELELKKKEVAKKKAIEVIEAEAIASTARAAKEVEALKTRWAPSVGTRTLENSFVSGSSHQLPISPLKKPSTSRFDSIPSSEQQQSHQSQHQRVVPVPVVEEEELPFDSDRVPSSIIESLYSLSISFPFVVPPWFHVVLSNQDGNYNFNHVKKLVGCQLVSSSINTSNQHQQQTQPQHVGYLLFPTFESRNAAMNIFKTIHPYKLNCKVGIDRIKNDSWKWSMMERVFRTVHCTSTYVNGTLVSPPSTSISIPSNIITGSQSMNSSPVISSQSISLPRAISQPIASTSTSIITPISNQTTSTSTIIHPPSTPLHYSTSPEPELEEFNELTDDLGKSLPLNWVRVKSQQWNVWFYRNELSGKPTWSNPWDLTLEERETGIIIEADDDDDNENENDKDGEGVEEEGVVKVGRKDSTVSTAEEEDELERLEVEKQLAPSPSTTSISRRFSNTISIISDDDDDEEIEEEVSLLNVPTLSTTTTNNPSLPTTTLSNSKFLSTFVAANPTSSISTGPTPLPLPVPLALPTLNSSTSLIPGLNQEKEIVISPLIERKRSHVADEEEEEEEEIYSLVPVLPNSVASSSSSSSVSTSYKKRNKYKNTSISTSTSIPTPISTPQLPSPTSTSTYAIPSLAARTERPIEIKGVAPIDYTTSSLVDRMNLNPIDSSNSTLINTSNIVNTKSNNGNNNTFNSKKSKYSKGSPIISNSNLSLTNINTEDNSDSVMELNTTSIPMSNMNTSSNSLRERMIPTGPNSNYSVNHYHNQQGGGSNNNNNSINGYKGKSNHHNTTTTTSNNNGNIRGGRGGGGIGKHIEKNKAEHHHPYQNNNTTRGGGGGKGSYRGGANGGGGGKSVIGNHQLESRLNPTPSTTSTNTNNNNNGNYNARGGGGVNSGSKRSNNGNGDQYHQYQFDNNNFNYNKKSKVNNNNNNGGGGGGGNSENSLLDRFNI